MARNRQKHPPTWAGGPSGASAPCSAGSAASLARRTGDRRGTQGSSRSHGLVAHVATLSLERGRPDEARLGRGESRLPPARGGGLPFQAGDGMPRLREAGGARRAERGLPPLPGGTSRSRARGVAVRPSAVSGLGTGWGLAATARPRAASLKPGLGWQWFPSAPGVEMVSSKDRTASAGQVSFTTSVMSCQTAEAVPWICCAHWQAAG